MPAKKLTLRLDEDVIALGKEFARRQGTSLSKLFEQYIQTLVPPPKEPVSIVEPDEDILALISPTSNLAEDSNRAYYDTYYDDYRAKYLANTEEE
ncbi:MAG: DUF6364 family protein [Bacteroidota bacterium]